MGIIFKSRVDKLEGELVELRKRLARLPYKVEMLKGRDPKTFESVRENCSKIHKHAMELLDETTWNSSEMERITKVVEDVNITYKLMGHTHF